MYTSPVKLLEAKAASEIFIQQGINTAKEFKKACECLTATEWYYIIPLINVIKPYIRRYTGNRKELFCIHLRASIEKNKYVTILEPNKYLYQEII